MGDGGVACAVRAVEGFGASALVRRGGAGEAMPDKGEKGHGHQHQQHHQQHRKSQQPASAAELEEGELLNGEPETNGLPERSMPPKKWRKVLAASTAAAEVEPGEIVSTKQAVPLKKARRNGEVEKGELVPERQRKDRSSGKSASTSATARKSGKDEVEPGEIALPEKRRDSKSQRGDDNGRKPSSSVQKGSLRDSDEEPGEIKPESSSTGSARKSRPTEPQSINHKHQADTSDQSGSKNRRKEEGRSSSAGRHLSGRNREVSPLTRDRHDRHERSPGILGRFPHDRFRHDRYDRSPSRLERSPHRERARYYDSRPQSIHFTSS